MADPGSSQKDQERKGRRTLVGQFEGIQKKMRAGGLAKKCGNLVKKENEKMPGTDAGQNMGE